MPELLKRVGTAAVLITLLVAALFLLPRAGVAFLMALVVAIGALEWARFCRLQGTQAGVYAALVVLAFFALFVAEVRMAAFCVGAAFWIIAVPVWLWVGVKAQQRAMLVAAGFVVLVPPALAMVALTPSEALAVLAVAWIADTGAYFAGKRWGRHKLAPSISPGKTWEGAAGGLLAAAAYAIILSISASGGTTGMAFFIGVTLVLGVMSIVGDLFESAAKRQAGLKDSGTLLPGHGGMLDRIDSATAILPVAGAMVALASRAA
ncbi:MAG TPA: phosphatidate cytidylyltransferase [Burkholderiales bacterium]|nr:phosphatidate cytidylyltransferase [Burkholderiales bacterium]